MTVKLWIGQEFDTTHERRTFNRFVTDMMARYGTSQDYYHILANYYIQGRQIDLTILKRNAIIVVELKDCSAPFKATENGSWLTIPDGDAIGTGTENPFQQAKAYRFLWMNYLEAHKAQFLSPAKANSMTDVSHISAFVTITPTLLEGCINNISKMLWFRLIGLDQLSEAVYQQVTSKFNFSDEELTQLTSELLSLHPANTQGSLTYDRLGTLPEKIRNRYQLDKQLGQGGMGIVYKAYDPEIERDVVVKLINVPQHLHYDKFVMRFEREVKAAGQLNHRHIITIYDVGLSHQPPYVVMELLEGGTLEELLQQRSLTWQEVLIILRPLLDALRYAHKHNIVHRDIKPSNIMFTGNISPTSPVAKLADHLKLIDFGLAYQPDQNRITQVGGIIGTSKYLAPEQANDEALDRRVDIFAVGVIMFEAITGQNPLDKGSMHQTVIAVGSPEDIEMTPLSGKVPDQVIQLVKRAIAKNKNQRYADCDMFLTDLESCLQQPTSDITTQKIVSPNKLTHPNLHPHLEIESPYGTMLADSKFYIERQADEHCWNYVSHQQATTIFIQAARQMGKSSLMRHITHRTLKTYQRPFIFIDFQKFPEQYFENEEKLLINFCLMMGDALDLPEAIDKYWQGPRTNISKCTLYLSKYIIPKINGPFILAMDEVERVLDSPFKNDFFGMLRTWHNDRAYDPNFTRMSLFISSSTEPFLFIENPHQSPFNVAEPIYLQDFTESEVMDLNHRHNRPLTETQIKDLMNLIGGHPFLVRVAFYQLATGRTDMTTLLARAAAEDGPFGDHLQRYRRNVLTSPDLRASLEYIAKFQEHQEDQIFHRLKGAGLIKKANSQVVLRNNLYARYFEEHFDD